ncbi:MAG: cytochrome c [Thiogranum sp.]
MLRALPGCRELCWLLAGVMALATAAGARQDQSAARVTAHYEQGKAVYNFYCYQCHAYAGDARTLASTFLDPKPRDFTASDPEKLHSGKMVNAVTHGRAGTAMVSFADVLDSREIEAVVDFIRSEFMQGTRPALIYHTPENGWQNHQRYAVAFPFASGELPLDTPWEELTAAQRQGKRLFMDACISCHDRARVRNEGTIWELRSLSYPRRHYDHTRPLDLISGASPYALHDQPPVSDGLSPAEHRGARLFQVNCAFCHAADGTARNWIGSFLQPRPRDLTSPAIRKRSRSSLKSVIRTGLQGTSMPAWKDILDDGQIDDIIAYLQRGPAEPKDSSAAALQNTANDASSAPQWLTVSP